MVEIKLSCDASEFNLGDNLIADVSVEVDIVPRCHRHHSYPDDYCLEFAAFDVSFFGIKPKNKTMNLLNTFHNIDDIWDDLTEQQKNSVNSWIKSKIEEKETRDKIEEIYCNQMIADIFIIKKHNHRTKLFIFANRKKVGGNDLEG